MGIFLVTGTSAQGVTIGSPNPPDPSAILDLQSTQSGIAIPRMTSAQRNAIANPLEGLQIYNLTSHCLEIYFPSIGWSAVKCDCTQPPAQPGAITGNTIVCPNGLGINYSINAVPGAINYTWTVPPGANIVSGQGTSSITVNYGTQAGTITVTADNTCGSSSPVSVTITQSSVDANFSSAPASPVVNLAAVFTPGFTLPGTNYQWTFASGSPATSTAQNPSVIWSQTGTYVVSLLVTDVNGCSDTVNQNITVTNCPPFGGNTLTFNFTGAVQTWVVPNCVTQVQIQADGASGGIGHYGAGQQPGGLGGRAAGMLSVTPGQTLYIYVGGQGSSSSSSPALGGWNGGGNGYNLGNTSWIVAGGGGASDVRLGGQALNNRVIVAGGGGGGGGSGSWPNGGGGAGGGTSGGNGYDTSGGGYSGDRHGKGGTQSAGGAGATDTGGGATGSPGTLGQGGNASTGNNTLASGGGGGYYGGGGGSYHGGGGGGGSSYTGGVQNGTTASGQRLGNGQIILTW